MKKILVGIDGSTASLNALKFAVKMARLIGGELSAISVINEPIYREYYNDISAKLKAEAESILQKAAAGVEKDKVKITTQVEVGSPDVVLAEVAKKDKDIAMIVVGASGRGKGSRVFAGSKTHALLNHAVADLCCPVVVVPGSSDAFLKLF